MGRCVYLEPVPLTWMILKHHSTGHLVHLQWTCAKTLLLGLVHFLYSYLSNPSRPTAMFELISGRLLVILITLTCSCSFMLFGYDQGVLSGIIGADNQFGKDFNHPNPSTQGLIVSVYQLGNVAGSIGSFFCGDYLGRRKSIIFATVIMLIGAILQTGSVNRPMMYAARVITGIVNARSSNRNNPKTDTYYRVTARIPRRCQCGRLRQVRPKSVESW